MKRRITVILAASAALSVAVGYHVGKARASGIPTMNPLVYTGTLLDNGQPDTGSHFILLKLWNGSTLACSTIPAGNTQLVGGRFSIPLDPTCVPAIHQDPNVQIEVVVDGTSMGKTPVSAVPYAVEADTASNYAPGSAIASLVPPGSVIPYAGVAGGMVNPPPGWLVCDGSAVSRMTYAALYQAIGTGWGAGDGAMTFNLPDLRGMFLRGVDPTAMRDANASARTAIQAGGNTGATVGTLETDAFQGHWHHYAAKSWGVNTSHFDDTWMVWDDAIGPPKSQDTIVQAPISDGVNGVPRTAGETRPINAAVTYIIKI
jgi:microcystin-dependent protein